MIQWTPSLEQVYSILKQGQMLGVLSLNQELILGRLELLRMQSEMLRVRKVKVSEKTPAIR